MLDAETEVLNLINKIGLSGVMLGVTDYVANMTHHSGSGEEYDDGEPDPMIGWADRLHLLITMAQPYAVAIEGGKMSASEQGSNGRSLTIEVE